MININCHYALNIVDNQMTYEQKHIRSFVLSCYYAKFKRQIELYNKDFMICQTRYKWDRVT